MTETFINPPATLCRESYSSPTGMADAPGRLTRWARSGLLRSLERLEAGELSLRDPWGEFRFGNPQSELRAGVTVTSPEFYRQLLLGGSLGAAESYLAGDWDTDDLMPLLRIFARQLEVSRQMDRGALKAAKWLARLGHRFRANTRSGSAKNIRDHYDLGNDFFSLFLDETMMYSSAVFEHPGMSLQQASVAKLDRICRKLNLRPDDRVIEIGTGWGGFAEHAARHYGCHVTTTTISRQQYLFAKQRIRAAGLQDRVTLLLQDYRDLTGQYDKLVSIEMIEAVGHRYFDTYFRQCSRLLKPDGMMLIQGITMPEQRYADYLKSVDFIQKYIFPGGCLPSVLAISDSIARQTDLRMLHLEDLAEHYAETLKCWRERFFARVDEIREQGFSDRFVRMWNYYFC